jgi:hypothetical protein
MSIVVTPGEARPGQKVHISVPDCAVGPTEHSAASAAFTRDVVLSGKADTGDADAVLRKELKPGTYAITAHCGAAQSVRGQVVVRGGTGDMAPYWLLGVLLVAAGAGILLLRRRA